MRHVRKAGLMLLMAGASVIGKPNHAVASTSSSADASTPWASSVKAALARRAEEVNGDISSLSEKGVASWYKGRALRRKPGKGAGGAAELTAAHPSAPMGSKLKITSETTGRSVVVTVNDRGPFIKGRIIDLSKAAATKIGLISRGVGTVTVEPVEVAQAPEK